MREESSTSKRRLVFVGDVHGYVHSLFSHALEDSYTNTDFVVLGDFGVGFRFFNDELKDSKKLLEENKELGNRFYVLRGNHDDPDYFNWKKTLDCPESKIIIFKQDCSAAILGDNKTVFFFGGGVSSDKHWRIQKATPSEPLYWEDELPVLRDFAECEDIAQFARNFARIHDMKRQLYCEETIRENLRRKKTFKNTELKFPEPKTLYVATHSAPVWCKPNIKWDGKIGDAEIRKENDLERGTLSRLYYVLKRNLNFCSHKDSVQFKWFYGHFHDSSSMVFGQDSFTGLSPLEFYEPEKETPVYRVRNTFLNGRNLL